MTKKERGDKWDHEIIVCRVHPDRRCNRSNFVGDGGRRCGSCKTTYRRDGMRRSAHLRHDTSEQKHWKRNSRRKYLRIQERKI